MINQQKPMPSEILQIIRHLPDIKSGPLPDYLSTYEYYAFPITFSNSGAPLHKICADAFTRKTVEAFCFQDKEGRFLTIYTCEGAYAITREMVQIGRGPVRMGEPQLTWHKMR